MRIALLFSCALAAFGQPSGEFVAAIDMTAKGADWAVPGRESALGSVSIGGQPQFHVFPYAGAQRHAYHVFYTTPSGTRDVRVERDSRYSAPGVTLEVHKVDEQPLRPGAPDYAAIANAPILYARPDTLAKFSDFPLLTYCERHEENGQTLLQYTVILSNEDGGTSSRALMARWGRTTDIEYVYRAYVDPNGKPLRATIQAKDHEEIEFNGKREGFHPVLYIATRNNMVAAEGDSPVRFQIAPIVVDLSAHSREEVMNANPLTYELTAKELQREGKLRPFGSVEGENVSDPRNYLYFEEKLTNRRAAVTTRVRLHGERVWRSSGTGRLDFAISRDGWIQTTVELPPGAKPAQVAEIGFECLVLPDDKGKWPVSGECRVDQVSKVFFLGADYRPGPSVWSHTAGPLQLQPGAMVTFPISPAAAR